MQKSIWRLTMLLLLLAQNVVASDLVTLPAGNSDIQFSNWSGPAIRVRLFVPDAATESTPIVIVMHGASREVDRYFNDWQTQGELHGFIVVVPEFPKSDFEGSAQFNLGNVFDKESGEERPEDLWTFSAIEPLFDQVVALTGSSQSGYTLFGHSAGSQFVHRFIYYKPNARATRVIAANAGWYTLPFFGAKYPYGLDESGIDPATLQSVFARDVVILLGDADTDPNHESLRKTPEAELQGPHRYARGVMMYRIAEAKAAELGYEFNWRLRTVAGAGHHDSQMAPAAAELVAP